MKNSKKSAALTAVEKEALQKETALVAELDKKALELKKALKLTDVFVLRVGDKSAFLKKPTRQDAGMARSLGNGDYIASNELLLDSIWIEGDEEIRSDDDYFLNAIPMLEQLIEAKAVQLKKKLVEASIDPASPGAIVRMVNAQISYYLKRNPDEMTDEQWADAWQELIWIRTEEAKHNKG